MLKYSKIDKLNEEIHQRLSSNGQYQYIAVTRLFNYCERVNMNIQKMAILRDTAIKLKQEKPVELERLTHLKPEHMRKPCLIILDNHQEVLVDGRYRYLMAILTKRIQLPAYYISPVVWRQYLIKDVPKNISDLIKPNGGKDV